MCPAACPQARLPEVYNSNFTVSEIENTIGAAGDKELIEKKFPSLYGKPSVSFDPGKAGAGARPHGKPLRIGVCLSGGQAPGGHNVIAGIYDYVKETGGQCIGFLNGPHGIMNGVTVELDDERMDAFRNMGGFDIIGSGRHKIETPEQFGAWGA